MTRTTIEPTPTHRTRRSVLAGVAVLGLVAAACGGDDDESTDDATTTTAVAPAVTSTTVAATTTTTTTTTLPPVEYVTEGATVVVANASGVNGAAGRLTDRLAAVGFDMAPATNSAETVSNLTVTQIYYDAETEGALAVAESLKEGFGGGDIEVLEVAVPAPTESGELGDAQVLVLMGNDIADKSLEELQGRVPPAEETTDDTGDDSGDDSTGDDTTTDDTGDDTTDDTGDETTDDTGDDSTGDDTTTDDAGDDTTDG